MSVYSTIVDFMHVWNSEALHKIVSFVEMCLLIEVKIPCAARFFIGRDKNDKEDVTLIFLIGNFKSSVNFYGKLPLTLILMRYVAFTTFCLKSFELPFPLFRNGKTSIWSGTSRITGRLKTSEFPPNISGNRIFSCITGCSEAFYFTLMPYFCQRWWGFWRDVSHKRDCN